MNEADRTFFDSASERSQQAAHLELLLVVRFIVSAAQAGGKTQQESQTRRGTCIRFFRGGCPS